MPKFVPHCGQTPSPAMVEKYGIHLAQLLCIRDIHDPETAEAFLYPSPDQFHDPLLLYGASRAMELFRRAKSEGKKAVVWGDYDTDGICASAIMTIALHRFGIQVSTYTPLREEGYGLNKPAIEKIRDRCDLLVTVDLGITNHEEVRFAQSLGMTVVVTDHHTPGEEPSPADAVVHPALGDYPCKKLCGTGVAFKLAQAILGMKQSWELLDLASIGTIADLVPLVGENRVIAALGLPLISERKRPGIRALLKVIGQEGEVRSDVIAYQLAPRLNASGRMGDAGEGVRLMLTHNDGEAERIALQLEDWNTQRRRYEDLVIKDCEEQIVDIDMLRDWGLMLRGDGWNSGVVGLAAGRITNKYACPSCVVTQSGDNQLTGSLRSVPGINIHRCLTRCDDLLLHWGGHEAAAGITLRADLYDTFRTRLMEEIMKADPKCFLPRREYEMAVHINELNEDFMRDIERLSPFGLGNPAPLLALFGVKLTSRRAVGTDGKHLKVELQEGDALIDGIAFQKGELASRLPDRVDVIFQLTRNTYRGISRLQATICEIEPEAEAKLNKMKATPKEEVQLAMLRYLKSAGDEMGPEENETVNVSRIFTESPESVSESLASILPVPERGHLLVCHTPETAAHWLEKYPFLLPHESFNPQHFPQLLACPEAVPVEGDWRHIWLLDGALFPDEASLWIRHYPKATVHMLPKNRLLSRLAQEVHSSRDDWTLVYRALRSHEPAALEVLCRLCNLSRPKTWAILNVLQEAGLIRFTEKPFTKEILPYAEKINPVDYSALWRRIRDLSKVL